MPRERRRRSDDLPSSVAEDRTPPVTDDAIRRRAYGLYESRGGEPGRDWDDWFQAERELRLGHEDE